MDNFRILRWMTSVSYDILLCEGASLANVFIKDFLANSIVIAVQLYMKFVFEMLEKPHHYVECMLSISRSQYIKRLRQRAICSNLQVHVYMNTE